MPDRILPKLIAELIGVFALTFVGIMAIYNMRDAGAIGLIVVALAHGLILAIMISALGSTSGGHFNPAVTLGFLATGKIKPATAGAYIVSQLLGGLLAAWIVSMTFGVEAVARGTPDCGTGKAGVAVVLEIVATFFLVIAIWGTAVDARAPKVGGFAIGLTVAADILAFGPITGASMNPARSLGPTLIGSAHNSALWNAHWVYWVGPIIGAVIAALVYRYIILPPEQKA